MLFLCLIAILLLVALCAYGKAFYVSPRHRKKSFPMPGSEQYERVKDQTHALYREMEALPYEQVFISSFDGLKLAGRYYHVQDGAPLQIQFHGYRSNGLRDFCGGHKLARESGHNTLVVDQRAHGLSDGRTIAFGVMERRDCLAWTRYAAERFGAETPVLLSGISMGGATVLMASGLDLPPNVCGIIADSPYGDPAAIIRKVCRDMHLPPALAFPFVRLGARLFGRFDPCAANACTAVKQSRVPILILHGEDDRFVPWQMSAEIHRSNPQKIRYETFPGAGHGLSYIADPERYAEIVQTFIKSCLPRNS